MSLHSCHPLFYERPSRWLFTGKVSSQCRRIHIYIYAVNIRGFAWHRHKTPDLLPVFFFFSPFLFQTHQTTPEDLLCEEDISPSYHKDDHQ